MPRAYTQAPMPPAYTQAVPQPSMVHVPSMTTLSSIRVSSRSNKGQTSKYDEFVQQLTIEPGNYVTDGINLFKMENTSNMAVDNGHAVLPPDLDD